MKLEGNSSREEDGNGILLQPRKGSIVRLQITPVKPKTITHLPKRPPVDLAFTDLTYTVREGRKNSEYFLFLPFTIIFTITQWPWEAKKKNLIVTLKRLITFSRICHISKQLQWIDCVFPRKWKIIRKQKNQRNKINCWSRVIRDFLGSPKSPSFVFDFRNNYRAIPLVQYLRKVISSTSTKKKLKIIGPFGIDVVNNLGDLRFLNSPKVTNVRATTQTTCVRHEFKKAAAIHFQLNEIEIRLVIIKTHGK